HRTDRVGYHLVDGVHADGDIGGDHRVATAQHLVQGSVVELSEQVIDGNFHRGLGAGVLLHRGLDQSRDAVQIGDVLANQARGDVVAARVDDGSVGVAGDDGGGRCLAVADLAAVGVDHHHHVFALLDSAQGGLEWRLQGHAKHAEFNAGDL